MNLKEKFRPNVGAVLRNPEGLVLLGERLDMPDAWQLPQGGVHKGEPLEEALFRELGEELGLDNPRALCRLLAQGPTIPYRFPPSFTGKITRRYAGQEQTLFLLDFLGSDADFDLDAHTSPEFAALQWVTPTQALALLWEVKRPIFSASLEAWSEHLSAPT